ncbi:hypothetical protein [Mycolicibacterium holsaticum]|uniref:Uncharacterized protein n=1 Tax=Mycolicibacterium holsaticum TaxID=152142 RepID=A0A1E3R7D7_9MYCO|nr:hypothetical protein [Mycolicibacterium holsaticum]ODQ85327.1 hypothetical protein BHQ17_23705 [Mycolicibacterium holsaticum]
MAFTVTYADGTVTAYDDKTSWTVDGGVLKMGAVEGQWTFLVSPSFWSKIETDPQKPKETGIPRRLY